MIYPAAESEPEKELMFRWKGIGITINKKALLT
jgi:hypothetical protein